MKATSSKEFCLLNRLQDWYLSNCDGNWEHQFGLSISTIDNPGWSVKINIDNTRLSGRQFTAVESNLDEKKGKDNWYICKVEDRIFTAACGPGMLSEVVSVFLKWAET